MRNTEQTLDVAIAELRCIRPGAPATLDELTALATARDIIEEMLRACVLELHTTPVAAYSWAQMAAALGADSADAVRKKYSGPNASTPITAAARTIVAPLGSVADFWAAYSTRFSWDLLPSDFLYALYLVWLTTEHPEKAALPAAAFTRRLKDATRSSAEWQYTRSRPGALMQADEPLLDLVPNWRPTAANAAIYGLRRAT